jgi:hypothetical protein
MVRHQVQEEVQAAVAADRLDEAGSITIWRTVTLAPNREELLEIDVTRTRWVSIRRQKLIACLHAWN